MGSLRCGIPVASGIGRAQQLKTDRESRNKRIRKGFLTGIVCVVGLLFGTVFVFCLLMVVLVIYRVQDGVGVLGELWRSGEVGGQ